MLLVMGDFNTKVGIKEPSAMSSAVVLYGLEETIAKPVSSQKTCAWSTSWFWHVETTSKAAVYPDLS